MLQVNDLISGRNAFKISRINNACTVYLQDIVFKKSKNENYQLNICLIVITVFWLCVASLVS